MSGGWPFGPNRDSEEGEGSQEAIKSGLSSPSAIGLHPVMLSRINYKDRPNGAIHEFSCRGFADCIGEALASRLCRNEKKRLLNQVVAYERIE